MLLYEDVKFVRWEFVSKWLTDVGLQARFSNSSGRPPTSNEVPGKKFGTINLLLIIRSILSERGSG